VVTPAPKRRWFRYSLWTLFMVVTVFCCWLGYELNWVWQRHEAFKKGQVGVDESLDNSFGPGPANVPAPLWLFGEPGYSIIWFNTAQESLVPTAEELVAIERIKRLFPEAQIGFMYTPPKRPQPVPEKTRQSGSAYDGFKL
jgi:hypothetical protein